MSEAEFLASIHPAHAGLILQLLPVIDELDPGLQRGVVQVMGTNMLGYKQSGEFKYAFDSRKDHLSFHNMVMYCYPELHKEISALFSGVKIQKSCLNLKAPEKLDQEAFRSMIRASASKPYPSELQLKRKR